MGPIVWMQKVLELLVSPFWLIVMQAGVNQVTHFNAQKLCGLL